MTGMFVERVLGLRREKERDTEDRKVMVGKFTRREFREAMEEGQFKGAIVATGATEQHLEHLPMEHDIATVTHVAQEAALRLYPQVVVTVPMSLGISEHHMMHKGSMTVKPGSWMAVLFVSVCLQPNRRETPHFFRYNH